jgi:hypothetical protein
MAKHEFRRGKQDWRPKIKEVTKAISSSFNNFDLIVSSFDWTISVVTIFKAGDNLFTMPPESPLNFLK